MAPSPQGPLRPRDTDTSPDDGTSPEPSSWLLGFGATVGAALLGTVVACAPATLRLRGGERACGLIDTWTLLIAVALVPMSVAILVLRRARVGFVALGKSGGVVQRPTLLLWILSTFGFMTCLGALLRAKTHHRALGGVVFALTALVVTVALALLSQRVVAMVQRLPRFVLGVLGSITAGGLGFLIAVLRARVLRSTVPLLPPAESARLVDGLAFVLAAFMASGSPLLVRRSLALLGPPLAVVIVVLGVSSLRTCPPLTDVLSEQAPLFAWLVSLMASH